MRGKRAAQLRGRTLIRITPAHAGKTYVTTELDNLIQDHPRACGENAYEYRNGFDVTGSPPRMRGKHTDAMALNIHDRITPAHAGKTQHCLICPFVSWDHPRACGENLSALFLMTACTGSPPRMRGKLYRAAGIAEKYRITPAHAGKTLRRTVRRPFAKDHPRACGENFNTLRKTVTDVGSPPRMRGKLSFESALSEIVGITPAHAGKTLRV